MSSDFGLSSSISNGVSSGLSSLIGGLTNNLSSKLAGKLAGGLLGDITSRFDFAALIEQRGRMLQINTALPQLALIPERAVLHEAVSQPFELVVEFNARGQMCRAMSRQLYGRLPDCK